MQTSIRITATSVFRSCSSASRAGASLDQVFAQIAQDDLVAQQLRRLVVDQQDVDLLRPSRHNACLAQRCSHMRNAAKKLLGVDRLGKIVRSAGLETLLAIALHGFGGQRDDRQAPRTLGSTRIACMVW